MKRTCLPVFAAVALALPLGMSAEEDQLQTITSQTLASQPAGTPYALDLRVGAAYSVSADVASRVRIGTITLADLAKKLGISGPTLEVTMISGGRVASLPAGGVTYAKCDKYTCSCVAGKDCTDLSKSGLCEPTPSAESSPLLCGRIDAVGTRGCVCTRKS